MKKASVGLLKREIDHPIIRDPNKEKLQLYSKALYLLKYDCKCGYCFFIMDIPHIDFRPRCCYCGKKENIYVGFAEIGA